MTRFAFVLSVVAAVGLAQAAPAQTPTWVAAASDGAGLWGVSSGMATRADAEQSAIEQCGIYCKLKFTSEARCVAYAFSETGRAEGFGAGPSKTDVEQQAWAEPMPTFRPIPAPSEPRAVSNRTARATSLPGSAAQRDAGLLVQPFARFVKIGEDRDRPLSLLGHGRDFACHVAAAGIDDEGQRTALGRAGTLRMNVTSALIRDSPRPSWRRQRRRACDSASRRTSRIPWPLSGIVGGDGAVTDGHRERVSMEDSNVDGHGLRARTIPIREAGATVEIIDRIISAHFSTHGPKYPHRG